MLFIVEWRKNSFKEIKLFNSEKIGVASFYFVRSNYISFTIPCQKKLC